MIFLRITEFFAIYNVLYFFYVSIADADIGSLKSLYTLFDKYLDHMLVKFKQNRMVRTIKNFEFFDKMINNFLTKR